MDSVKSAVGLGKKDEVKQEEPVSGEQGEGTTAEPFDAGNQDAQDSEVKESKEEGTTDSTTLPRSAETPEDSKKKAGLLKSVNPFSKKSKDSSEATTDSKDKQATAGAEKQEQEKLAPNHLGFDIPTGASTDFAPPGTPGEGAVPEEPQQPKDKGKMAETEPNQSVANASADGVDNQEGKFGQAGLLDSPQQRSPSGPNPSQLRGSRTSIAAPTGQRIFNPHATNPGRIPTAGGVAVGSRQADQRRASRVSSDIGTTSSSGGGPPGPISEEGYTDMPPATTTFSNTDPFGTANGEGSSKAAAATNEVPVQDEAGGPRDTTAAVGQDEAGAPKDTSAAVVAPPAANDTATKTETNASATDKIKDKVKENLSSPSSSGSKERRGSTFDKFKSKMGIGKKS